MYWTMYWTDFLLTMEISLLIADLVLVFHFWVVIFITVGLFIIPVGYKFGWVITTNRKIRLIHCSLMGLITSETLLGLTCPLTSIEQSLRGYHYSQSFIAHWISQIIYWNFPTQFFVALYCICLGWALFLWIFFPRKATWN